MQAYRNLCITVDIEKTNEGRPDQNGAGSGITGKMVEPDDIHHLNSKGRMSSDGRTSETTNRLAIHSAAGESVWWN